MQFFRLIEPAVVVVIMMFFSVGSSIRLPAIGRVQERAEFALGRGPMNMNGRNDQREHIFHEMVRSVNAGDAKTYARLYAPGAVITIYGGETLRGRAAIEKYEVELLTQFPGTKFSIEEVWLVGSDQAAARYGVNGASADGKPMGHEGLLFYVFDSDGLISSEKRYLDSYTPMAQLGAFGPTSFRPLPKLSGSMIVVNAEALPYRNEMLSRLIKLISSDKPVSLEALREVFADSAVLDDLTEPEPRQGLNAIQQWLNQWVAAISDFKTAFTIPLRTNDRYLLQTTVAGRLVNNLGRVQASGDPVCVSRAWLMETSHGKVVRLRVFMNAKELAEPAKTWVD